MDYGSGGKGPEKRVQGQNLKNLLKMGNGY
jgi:hypothetical protein